MCDSTFVFYNYNSSVFIYLIFHKHARHAKCKVQSAFLKKFEIYNLHTHLRDFGETLRPVYAWAFPGDPYQGSKILVSSLMPNQRHLDCVKQYVAHGRPPVHVCRRHTLSLHCRLNKHWLTLALNNSIIQYISFSY